MQPTEALSAAVWADLLAAQECQDDSGCAAYYMPLFRAAEQAGKEGRCDDAAALKALGGACSMMLEPRRAPAPFRPVMQMESSRSALPEDFDPVAIALFRAVVGKSDNPELRARLSDIVWLRERDAGVARQAVQSYFEAADSNHLKFNHDRVKRIIRAAQISLQLNVRDAERDALVARLEDAAARLAEAKRPQRALEVLEFMLAEDLIDATATLSKFESIFGPLDMISPSFVRRNVLLFKAKLHDSVKDKALGKDAVVEAAETFVEEAEQTPAALAKSLFLEQAIHLLRSVKHHRSHADVVRRIQDLKTELMELRDHVLASMEVHEFGPFDMGEQVQQAVAAVSGKEPREVLLTIARMLSRPHVDSLRESATQSLQGSVLGRLFGAKQLGSNGRTVGKRAGAGDLSQPSEPEIVEQMLQMIGFWRRMVLAGSIEPARRCLNQQRYVSENDLQWLFDANPMVPHGHELLLARGLLAGIRGDFLEAGSFLIPQIEHLLRFRLNAQRIVTTGLNQEGIEDELPLERLMGLAEEHAVIDASVAFDLRSLLTERTGDNLRNEHAHGLIPSSGYYSDASRYLWAFVLRWLCLPYLRKEDSARTADPGGQEDHGRR